MNEEDGKRRNNLKKSLLLFPPPPSAPIMGTIHALVLCNESPNPKIVPF